MYIKKIKVKGYRNYLDTDIELRQGINIIVGPNNVGKSNLLTIINFLYEDPNKKKISIEDLNKNDLYNNFEKYKTSPPKIEITYEIYHEMDYTDEKSIAGFSKIIQFIVYNNGKFNKTSDSKQAVNAIVHLRYELEPTSVAEYKKAMKNVGSYEEYYKQLIKFSSKYAWSFYDNVNNPIKHSVVKNIFTIQYVGATRLVDDVTKNSRAYVTDKIMSSDVDCLEVKSKMTKVLQDSYCEVTNCIDKEIEEDQKNIGITDGKNKFVSQFDFNGEISDSFKYELENETYKYRLPLENNGLGYNNLIYIRNLIKQCSKTIHNILLLEEPEAHLHPNMQYKLVQYIRQLAGDDKVCKTAIDDQIIITTHSSNITASAEIKDMLLLYTECSENNIVNVGTVMLDKLFEYDYVKDYLVGDKSAIEVVLCKARQHLRKFLDVTRSEILFSDKIILVEGVAERLTIPKMFPNLVDRHVVIHDLGGINFDNFLPLTIGTNKKILCLTDLDFKYYTSNDGVIEVCEKIPKQCNYDHINKIFDNEKMNNILVKTQIENGNTFETQLFLANYNDKKAVQKILELVLPKNVYNICKDFDYYKVVKYLDDNNCVNEYGKSKEVVEKYVNIFKNKINGCVGEEKEKYISIFFTCIFYHYVENQKGQFALDILDYLKDGDIKPPKYIQEGVEWLLS